MDELKEFELLSDDEKIKIMKFYQFFSTAPFAEQVEAMLESGPQKSIGKQKTLDGWLLKKSEGTTNAVSGVENSMKKRNVVKSATFLNVSQKNLQSTAIGSGSETLEFRQDDTFKHIGTRGFISKTGPPNSKNKLISTKNVQSKTKKDSMTVAKFSNFESTELRQDNTLEQSIVKKNPFVLIERLDFANYPELNFPKNCAPDSNRKPNRQSSQKTVFSKPNTKVNKKPILKCSSEKVLEAVEKSHLEVGNPEGSSYNEKRNAYFKLKKVCSDRGLDLDDIFRRQEFKEMIEKYKSLPEAVLFIGSHKCAATGKVEPTLNVHKSKKQLLEALSALKTKKS